MNGKEEREVNNENTEYDPIDDQTINETIFSKHTEKNLIQMQIHHLEKLWPDADKVANWTQANISFRTFEQLPHMYRTM